MTCKAEHDWSEVEDTGGRYAVCTRCNALGVLRGVKLYGNNPDGVAYADGEAYVECDMHQVAMALYHAEDAAEASRIVNEYIDCIEG